MKKNRCQNCNDLIPEGQEAYISGKIVCQYCYDKLKIGNGRGESRESLIKTYQRWLARG